MKPQQLFRQAALENQQIKWLGNIVLIRPLSFTVLTIAAGLCALVVLLFLIFGTYTKRATVSGQLTPDSGLLKVYAPQGAAVIERKMVREGQSVQRGDVLFALSGERQSSAGGAIQASISRQVQARQDSLREELRKTRQLQEEERIALNRKLSALESEASKIISQLDGQKSRVKLAEDAVTRAQELVAQHFISKEQLQQRQADLLDQRNRLQALERDAISIERELSAQKTESASMPLRHQNQLAQLERVINTTGQELTESEAKRNLLVVAPEAGVVTAIAAEVGQRADPAKPMLAIVPKGASLLAELYAPSRAIGFVRVGDKVLLRYQAYPYQKFGHGRGKVLAVSKTALPASEINSMQGGSGNSGAEPMYKISVQLDAQTIAAYGRAEQLQAGMLLDADILQDTRRLYEWVLEPLFSLTGKL